MLPPCTSMLSTVHLHAFYNDVIDFLVDTWLVPVKEKAECRYGLQNGVLSRTCVILNTCVVTIIHFSVCCFQINVNYFTEKRIP